MDFVDEVRLAMQVYAARGYPQMPDQTAPTLGPSGWFARLTPVDQARMRHAIQLGARQSWAGVWSEQD